MIINASFEVALLPEDHQVEGGIQHRKLFYPSLQDCQHIYKLLLLNKV